MRDGHDRSEGAAEDVRKRCEELFERAGVEFRPFVHEAVLDYETAAVIRERLGLTGRETKALFLRGNSGRFVMFVSLEGERLDMKEARRRLDDKVSITTGEELESQTGCVPGCAVPFGLPTQVALLVDEKVKTAPRLIFSPGPPSETIEVDSAEWAKLMAAVDNSVVPY